MRATYEGMSAFNDQHMAFAERMIFVSEEMAMRIQMAFQTITDAVGNAIADLALGEATLSEVLNSMYKSLVRMAIQMMTTYFARMIASAIAHGTEKGGVIGGVAEGAAGLALWSSMVPALSYFAEGGLAYGPTMGMVGEYPGASTNPEVIAPLDKLQSMIGGGVQQVEVLGVIRGEDIHYVVQRQTNKLDRYR
jgi:hypothetical protein